MPTSSLLFSLLYILASVSITNGAQLIIVNNCNESIWPGILGSAGLATPQSGGFHLGSGEEVVLDVPEKWSGRIWGRQGCSFDSNGKGNCETGDCFGQLHCQGKGGIPPATVVEMTLGSSNSPLHFYDVSLVDGFNLPVSMKPVGGGIGCGVASCEVDLNICCPSALEVRRGGKVVGCKSACLAMQSAKYCCTGNYANPNTCKPTLFAHLFKAICPKAYSYAFDDSSSLNRCRASRVAAEVLQEMKDASAKFFELSLEEETKICMSLDELQGYGQIYTAAEGQIHDWCDALFLTVYPSHSRNPKFWPTTPKGFK